MKKNAKLHDARWTAIGRDFRRFIQGFSCWVLLDATGESYYLQIISPVISLYVEKAYSEKRAKALAVDITRALGRVVS